MRSTSPSDERTCDTTTLLRHSLPLSLPPDSPLPLLILHLCLCSSFQVSPCTATSPLRFFLPLFRLLSSRPTPALNHRSIPSAPETFPDFFSDSLGVSDRAGFNNGTPYNLRDSVTNMSRCVQIGTLLGVDARKVNSGGCEGFCFVIRILSISVLRVQR